MSIVSTYVNTQIKVSPESKRKLKVKVTIKHHTIHNNKYLSYRIRRTWHDLTWTGVHYRDPTLTDYWGLNQQII